MVVPFTADQPFWGRRTYELGVGHAPIPFTKLNADNLATAIKTMTKNAEMQRRAVGLRENMAKERGISQAVEAVRRYVT